MSGLRAMAPRPAIEASLRDHPTDPLVFSADADRLRLFLAVNMPHNRTPVPTATPDADTRQAVRVELASVLSMPDAATLDLDASLFDLGVDSLLALDLRKRIQRATGPVGSAGQIARRDHRRRVDRAPRPFRRAAGNTEKVNALRD